MARLDLFGQVQLVSRHQIEMFLLFQHFNVSLWSCAWGEKDININLEKYENSKK